MSLQPVAIYWNVLPGPSNQSPLTGRHSCGQAASYHQLEGAPMVRQPVATTQKVLPGPGNQLPPPAKQEKAVFVAAGHKQD